MRAALTPRSLRQWDATSRVRLGDPNDDVVGEAHPKAMLARLDAACRGIGLDEPGAVGRVISTWRSATRRHARPGGVTRGSASRSRTVSVAPAGSATACSISIGLRVFWIGFLGLVSLHA